MKKGHVNIIFLSYNWHKKTFPEIDELQCDADPEPTGTLADISGPRADKGFDMKKVM
jgi:hypothetical protein